MYYHMINWSYSIKFCLPLHLRILFTVVVNFKVLESVMMFRFKLFGSTSGLWILLPSHFTGPLGHISSFVTFDKSIFYIDEFTIPQTWRLIKKSVIFRAEIVYFSLLASYASLNAIDAYSLENTRIYRKIGIENRECESFISSPNRAPVVLWY